MLEIFFFILLCPFLWGVSVSDVHLIAASISFGAAHSRRPLKERFPWLSQNSAPPLMRPLGLGLALTWKRMVSVFPLLTVSGMSELASLEAGQIKYVPHIPTSCFSFPIKMKSTARFNLLNVITPWSSNYMLEHWDKDEMCLRPREDNSGNVRAPAACFQ